MFNDRLYTFGGQEGDFMAKPGSPIFKCSRRNEVNPILDLVEIILLLKLPTENKAHARCLAKTKNTKFELPNLRRKDCRCDKLRGFGIQNKRLLKLSVSHLSDLITPCRLYMMMFTC